MLFFCIFVNNFCMKRFFVFVLCTLVCLLVVGFCFCGQKSSSNADYLRIHIRANSNRDVDQSIKYKIKDEFVQYLTPKIAMCKTKADVVNVICDQKTNLQNLADSMLKNAGLDYTSNIKIDREVFPTRTYEGYTLESGVYDAIIVELGSAKGNNWWCVIYPPLCFTNYSSSNNQAVVYKSKIWEIIKQFFS